MKPRDALACVFLFLLTSPASSQQVWIVDRGSGAHFQEIQPAIDAATAGDRIEVRGAGPYRSFTLRKGVDLDATASAAVGPSVVEDVPPGEWVRVAGLNFTWNFPFTNPGPPLVVRRCFGPVTFASLSFSWSLDVGPPTIAECSAVLMLDCSATAGSVPPFIMPHALVVTSSRVTMQRCQFAGGRGSAPAFGPLGMGGNGLLATDSELMCSRCTFTGGLTPWNAAPCPATIGGRGVTTSGTALFMDRCSFKGGDVPLHCSPASRGHAVEGANAVTVTADCTVDGSTVNVNVVPPLPAIDTPVTALLGMPTRLVFTGLPGTVVLVYFDQIHTHLTIPGIEGALLLSISASSLPSLIIDGQGSAPLDMTVPNDPLLVNQFLFFQGIAFEPSAPLPSLTNLGDLRIR